MSSRRVVYGSFCSFVLLVAVIWFIQNYISRDKLRRLLQGDENVSIRRLEITTANETLTVVRHDDLQYVEDMFRRSKKTKHKFGRLITLTIDFNGIGWISVEGWLGENRLSVKKPGDTPAEPGWPTHDIIFDENCPKVIKDFFCSVLKSAKGWQ